MQNARRLSHSGVEGGRGRSVATSGAQEAKEPGEVVHPAAGPSEEAQQDKDEQSHPDLPVDGVGAVAEEVGQLQGLLDLIEERFDLPAATVQIGDTGVAPYEVIGEELHRDTLP